MRTFFVTIILIAVFAFHGNAQHTTVRFLDTIDSLMEPYAFQKLYFYNFKPNPLPSENIEIAESSPKSDTASRINITYLLQKTHQAISAFFIFKDKNGLILGKSSPANGLSVLTLNKTSFPVQLYFYRMNMEPVWAELKQFADYDLKIIFKEMPGIKPNSSTFQ